MKLLFAFLILFPLFSNAEPCSSLLQKDDVRLWSCGGLKVLVLKGTPEEKAAAHGALLGKGLSTAPFDQFADLLLASVQDSSVVHWIGERILGFWTWVYDRNAPEGYHKELKALADAAGVPVARARKAMLFPDTALFFWSLLESKWFRATGLACTSAAKKYDDGRFVYGRNLDFAGVNAFDAHPLMIVSLPKEGSSEIPHLIFGADGMLFGGLTGMNQAGISFAVHQNYTRDAHLGGVPMPYIGELVLREARTLDQAVEIIKKNRPGPLWTFLISDLNKGELRAVEVSQRHFEVRSMENGLFSQSNHTFHDSVRVDELIDPGTRINSYHRTERALEILRNGKGKGDASELMAQVLSDQKDAQGEMSIPDDIIKPLTIQSVILEKSKGAASEILVSLSYEGAPTSSGKFATFQTSKLWEALKATTLETKLQDLSHTPAPKRRLQIETAQAFAAACEANGTTKALEVIKNQKSVNAHLAKAIYQRKLEHGEEALREIKEARARTDFADQPRYVKQAFEWVELTSLWQLRRKDEGKKLATDLVSRRPLDPHLANFAADVAAGRAVNAEEADLDFDFFSGYIANLPATPNYWITLDPKTLAQ